MTVLYGEGQNAFLRLQLEIINKTNDESIFSWKDSGVHWLGTNTSDLLAQYPAAFLGSEDIVAGILTNRRSEYTMTSRGLKLEHLTVLEATQKTLRAMLSCSKAGSPNSYLGIHLARVDGEQYQRTRCSELIFWGQDLVGDEFRPLESAVFVKQPQPSHPIRHENITFSIEVASVLQSGFVRLCESGHLFPGNSTLFRSEIGMFTLKPGMVDGLVQDQAGAMLPYHNLASENNFAITVDSIDEQVGVDIVLAAGEVWSRQRRSLEKICKFLLR